MTESEKYILSACLVDPDAYYSAADYIHSPQVFADGKARIIWDAMSRIIGRNVPIDAGTVTHEINAMKMSEAVGADFLIGLTFDSIGSANTVYHSKIVVEQYISRQTISISEKGISKSKDPGRDVFDTLDEMQSELEALTSNLVQGRPIKAGDLAPTRIEMGIERVKRRREAEERGEEFTEGISTGIRTMDLILNGWLPGRFYVIAARPGMGKSAIVMNNFCMQAAKQGKPSLFKSLEMPKEELVDRIICAYSGVDYGRFQKGTLQGADISAMQGAQREIVEFPIYIEDTGGDSVLKLRAGVRKNRREIALEMLAVDNLSLIREKGYNRENEMARISGGLKRLAIEMEIPVLGISHLNRKCEDRPNRSPMLSDLRDSGAIEQDADSVIFIYRPAYYGEEYVNRVHSRELDSLARFNVPDGEAVLKELAQIDIAKNRGLMTGKFACRFIGRYTRFEEWMDSKIRGALDLGEIKQPAPKPRFEPDDEIENVFDGTPF